jgi:hypothetical protein
MFNTSLNYPPGAVLGPTVEEEREAPYAPHSSPVKVIVYIRGGAFNGAVADRPGAVELMIVDYDNESAGALGEGEVLADYRCYEKVQADPGLVERTENGIEGRD